MSDVTAAGGTGTLHFTRGKAREIIMVYEALCFFDTQTVNSLLLTGRAQSGDGQYLRVAATEQPRAMSTW